jgi:hypothetical protein
MRLSGIAYEFNTLDVYLLQTRMQVCRELRRLVPKAIERELERFSAGGCLSPVYNASSRKTLVNFSRGPMRLRKKLVISLR